MSPKRDSSAGGLLVIGAGLPRTGTASLRQALERLLGGKCYHMTTVIDNPDDPRHQEFWTAALQKRVAKEDWEEFLSDFRAGVDFPVSFYYRDLLRHFPSAKVVLSTREPDAWFRSVRDALMWGMDLRKVFPLNLFSLVSPNGPVAVVADGVCNASADGFDDGLLGHVRRGEDDAVRFFNRWNKGVVRDVSPDRLLVHRSTDGWEPLCSFLGLPVPEEPYPRVNSTAEMRGPIAARQRKAYAVVMGVTILMGILAAAFAFYCWQPSP